MSKRPLLIVLVLLAFHSVAETGTASQDQYSTPPGMTLVDVMYLRGEWTYQWTRLGDANGNTLFISDDDSVPGSAHCIDECAITFPPVIALEGSTATGDWSLVPRGNGLSQWAYRGKPLYRFAKETRMHEVVDNALVRELAMNNVLSKISFNDKDLLPPKGWHIARLNPAGEMSMPAGISVRNMSLFGFHGLVDVRGRTLYVLNGDPADTGTPQGQFFWEPLYAPALAGDVGSFSPMLRTDGRKQWHFRGAPLFTFSGDYDPGDANGINYAAEQGDPRWQAAALKQHYMPQGVVAKNQPVYGRVLFTADGKPLYSRNPLEIQRFYHRNVVYQKGKALGTKGCNAKCELEWPPYLAPDDAVARGYWEVLTRADGRRQWMYKGHALYTYSKDKTDGVVNGNNVYDYVIGDGGRYKIADVAELHSGISIGAALHWLVVVP